MSKIVKTVWSLAEPVVKGLGCELWDVEYIKEAGSWFLRVYIDKDGGVSISDCEAVSRALDTLLDEHDPIEESYVFEVSSAGAERELKRPSDFERFMGENVEVKLYKAVDGQKTFVGKLTGYSEGGVTIEASENQISFDKGQVANVRLRMV